MQIIVCTEQNTYIGLTGLCHDDQSTGRPLLGQQVKLPLVKQLQMLPEFHPLVWIWKIIHALADKPFSQHLAAKRALAQREYRCLDQWALSTTTF